MLGYRLSHLFHQVPVFTSLFNQVPVFTCLFHQVPVFTCLFNQVPVFTWMFNQVPVFTCLICSTRYLYLPLVDAERAWAYSMQLKSESNTEPRKKYHSISRLRKAVQHAKLLASLCDSDKCESRTKLEAQVSADTMCCVQPLCADTMCSHYVQTLCAEAMCRH